MLEYFFYFVLLGMLIFLLDWLLLRLRKQVLPASNLISGILAGIIVGLIMESVYSALSNIWLFPPIMGLCAGIVLAIAVRLDLYDRAFFRLFGTITLALATGILVWLSFLVLSFVGGGGQDLFSTTTLIDFLMFSFVIHFGYVFSARIVNSLFPQKPTE